jgi:hypothetical protein
MTAPDPQLLIEYLRRGELLTERKGGATQAHPPFLRMSAISLGDLTGCNALQQSFEAVKAALDETRRSERPVWRGRSRALTEVNGWDLP